MMGMLLPIEPKTVAVVPIFVNTGVALLPAVFAGQSTAGRRTGCAGVGD